MISVAQALDCIDDLSIHSQSVQAAVGIDLLGAVLKENIVAPIALPEFRQSAMDGYALALHPSDSYTVVGEVAAGQLPNYSLTPGQAVRIFTGAPLPDTAEAIIIQEEVVRENDTIRCKTLPQENRFIRSIGSQIKKGTVVLEKGDALKASDLGILATLGITHVKISAPPKISLLVTGNELIPLGGIKNSAQVYESNSLVLGAALRKLNLEATVMPLVPDTLEKTVAALKKAIHTSDLVLISGGISVGDYDFVKPALERLSVKTHFYKIRQKPGKPLYFGQQQDCYIFGLPGNPASALSCFHLYVRRLLEKMQGKKNSEIIKFPMAETFTNPFDRALLIKAQLTSSGMVPLDDYNSASLNRFRSATHIVHIPENQKEIAAGQEVASFQID